MLRFQTLSASHRHNANAWDALARKQVELARPARDEDFVDPLGTVDPVGWLGGDIRGQRVLCLAAGGGRHSAMYAAAGGVVTVVDLSSEMLAQDRAVAAERNLSIRVVQTSMDDLAALETGEFDLVIHPVSTCYVPDVARVYQEVARVTRPGGVYISQHKTPSSLQTEQKPSDTGYRITETYYRTGPLPPGASGHLREPGTLEYLHRWEELLGTMCRCGFVIEDLLEPRYADDSARPGSFGHRAKFVAPYVRVKARRAGRSDRNLIA